MDEEKVEAAVETPKAKGKVKAPASGAEVAGRLAGAGTALPTMAVTYAAAVLAGVPGPTALVRSLVAALVMWVFVGLMVRMLFGALLSDWKKARASRVHREIGR